MIAFRRADVADLNGRARALMRASGELGEREVVLPGGTFALGDRVMLRRNDRRLGVTNGDRGVVVEVDARARSVDVDVGGRRLRLDGAYLGRTSERTGPSVMHGYAITGHSAQGLTCDRAFVLVTSEASREWCYTALSRGRISNRLYAVAPEMAERAEYAPGAEPTGDGRDALAAALGRSTAQTLASEAAQRDRQEARALKREAATRRELVDAVRELELAERDLVRARRSRQAIEDEQRPWLTIAARSRRSNRLDAARGTEAAMDRRLETLRREVAALRARVRSDERLRALRQARPERVIRARTVDRGIDIGR